MWIPSPLCGGFCFLEGRSSWLVRAPMTKARGAPMIRVPGPDATGFHGDYRLSRWKLAQTDQVQRQMTQVAHLISALPKLL